METVEKHYQDEKVVSKYEKKRFSSTGGQFVDQSEKEIILSLLKEEKPRKILDLGAGTGRISLLLAEEGYDVTSFDQSDEMLGTIEKKAKEGDLKISLIKGDAFNLPFEDNTFDSCISLRVLWHFKNPEKIMKEVQRVLKKDGTFIFDLLNKKSLRTPYAPIANSFVYTNLMSTKKMKETINSSDLKIAKVKRFFIFPYAFYMCSPKPMANLLKNLEKKLQNTNSKKYSSVIYFKTKK
jgi:ubiquinone/menaquinone biosynthesis C-methylase UbiE